MRPGERPGQVDDDEAVEGSAAWSGAVVGSRCERSRAARLSPVPALRPVRRRTSLDGRPAALPASRAARAPAAPPVIAVDGPQRGRQVGVRATLWRAALGDAPVVRLDDVYPGWDGLEDGVHAAGQRRAASRVAAGATATAAPATTGSPGATAPAYVVPAAPLVVLEGCGAGAGACAPLPVVRWSWVDASDDGPLGPGDARATARGTGRTGPGGPSRSAAHFGPGGHRGSARTSSCTPPAGRSLPLCGNDPALAKPERSDRASGPGRGQRPRGARAPAPAPRAGTRSGRRTPSSTSRARRRPAPAERRRTRGVPRHGDRGRQRRPPPARPRRCPPAHHRRVVGGGSAVSVRRLRSATRPQRPAGRARPRPNDARGHLQRLRTRRRGRPVEAGTQLAERSRRGA